MAKPPKATPEKFDLRLPAGLRARLSARAAQEHRSSNAQAVPYIEDGVEGIGNAELAASIRSIEAAIAEIRQLLTKKDE